VRWVVLDLRRGLAIDDPGGRLLNALLGEVAARGITTLFGDPRGPPPGGLPMRSHSPPPRPRGRETAPELAEEALLVREDLFTLPPTVHVPLESQDLLAGLQREDVAFIEAATETRTYNRGRGRLRRGRPGGRALLRYPRAGEHRGERRREPLV